jgi:hypothetical protein
LARFKTPESPEGTIHWVEPKDLAALDLIDNAARVIPLLIEDLGRDREGSEPLRLGVARYDQWGALRAVLWT